MPMIMMPFAGLRFHPHHVPDLSVVMTPPYDVISASERAAYLAQHPQNMVHLVLGAEYEDDDDAHNRFTRAGALLRQWRDTGVLVQESQPALYLYQQDFDVDGRAVTRTGVIGRVRLADYQDGVIFPHEHTFAGPKADLLRLWRACHANLSQIFSVYRDPAYRLEAVFAAIGARPPDLVVPYWGEGAHRLWSVTAPNMIAQIQHALRDMPLVIADGHHRYETALALRDEMRQRQPSSNATAPYEYVMMYCANSADPGVLALPTHRFVHQIPVTGLEAALQSLSWVQVEVQTRQAQENVEQWQRRVEVRLRQGRQHESVFGFYAGGDRCYIVMVPAASAVQQVQAEGVSAAWKQLDVSVLHYALLPSLQRLLVAPQAHVTYARSHDPVFHTVQDGQCDLAVLLRATPVEAMHTIALGGERMPQKSTYFYPKLPTGLVMNSFDA
jgi:uncharacterized protein (DUF1015 family)